MKPSIGCFHRLSQIGQGFDLFAVHFRDREIGEIVVTDRAGGRQHLAQNDDAAISFRKQFRLESIHVNKTRRRFFLPVRAPFLEILPRELLENQAAENVIGRRLVRL